MSATSLAKNFNGVLIYDGPSTIDGVPIIALATNLRMQSLNPKTGVTVQVYILRRDVGPIEATNTGQDVSICGDCIFRKANAGGCYVNIGYSVNNVFRAYLRGKYERATWEAIREERGRLLAGRVVRIGAYGDPAAVPYPVWQQFLQHAGSVIGYTHQWRDCDQRMRRFCMASCETVMDTCIARARGWRSFRVMVPGQETMVGEIVCPASKEGGRRATCASCRLCGGTSVEAKDIAIYVHGRRANNYIREFA